uniref:5-hydroxytryptamine receptor 1A-like n=1 Tax=Petromyzon marinus TaxID=7757 RepID=A0AAJ7WUU2_PETMA|nr:5-hydroxytryptamine receptor 1A-like [Petromyzon marinus]
MEAHNITGSAPALAVSAAQGNSSEPSSVAYTVISSLCLTALILCAIFGNSCVIAAIALERTLQNVANYLIGSLAVTDLLVSILVLPMAALYQVLDRWTLGQVVCDIFIALDVLCCTSSILHLCVIALDRYWAITNPIDYVNKRTPRRAVIMISLTWLVGFSISIPPMLGWRTPEDRADPNACKISQDHGYTIYSTFGAFYIPLILMLVLYSRIFRAARFRIRKNVKKATEKKSFDAPFAISNRAEMPSAAAEAETAAPPSPAPCNGDSKQRSHRDLALPEAVGARSPSSLAHSSARPHLSPAMMPTQQQQQQHGNGTGADACRRKTALARERKTVKTLGIIMGTFIFCWLPFFIVALISPFCGERCHLPPGVFAVINWLGYSNSLLNPIIYAYFNKDFQNAFKKIIKCKLCRQ